jgi:hypothetical protein
LLPLGCEREWVLDRDRLYEIDGAESRVLANVRAFRVVSERDLENQRDYASDAQATLKQLRDEELARSARQVLENG